MSKRIKNRNLKKPAKVKKNRKADSVASGTAIGKDDYEVGYKKPPLQTQFKPGVSGNPSGRPKGRKSIPSIIYHQGIRTVTVSTPDGPQMITMAEAAVLKIWEKVLKDGDVKAIKFLAENYQIYEEKNYGELISQDMAETVFARLFASAMLGKIDPQVIALIDAIGYENITESELEEINRLHDRQKAEYERSARKRTREVTARDNAENAEHAEYEEEGG